MKEWVIKDIENEIIKKYSKLNETNFIYIGGLIKGNLNLHDFDSIIDSYFESDYNDDGYHDSGGTEHTYISDFETILERLI